MKITVKVKPNSKIELVEKTGENQYLVRVKEPPTEGRANAAVVKALANHFGLPKSAVRLTHGQSAKTKLFEIG